MPPDGNVKKERGCFQCSCRRIVCDKTEPSCRKCAKKGIECSGMGRIRFAEGVARRGRLKDCKIPKTGGDDSCKELPNTIEFQLLRWPGEERARKKRKSDLNETAQGPPTPHTINSTGMHDGREAFLLSAPINTNADSEADMEDIGRGYNSIVVRYSESYEIVPWVAPIDPKLRMLFSYCKLQSRIGHSLTIYSQSYSLSCRCPSYGGVRRQQKWLQIISPTNGARRRSAAPGSGCCGCTTS